MRIEGCTNLWSNKSPGVSLILCSFSSIVAVDSLIGPVTYLLTGSDLDNCAKHEFCLMKRVIKPIRKWSVTPITLS